MNSRANGTITNNQNYDLVRINGFIFKTKFDISFLFES